MIPLLGVSFALWTLIAERWQVLRTLQRDDLDMAGVLSVVRGEQEPPESRSMRSRLAGEFASAATNKARVDRNVLAYVSFRIARELDRRLEVISVLAVVAPLLGLLGTVLGMIETFQVISDYGTGNARAMAGGISVALVTTQTGLLVAIPGLLESGRLRRNAEQLQLSLAETTHMIDRDLVRRCPPRRRKQAGKRRKSP
jgi:biopolymer transport protein ExbB